MILDSSALAAILFKEADAQRFADAIGEADEVAIAAPTLVEITMVTEGRARPGMAEKLDALIAAAGAEIVPFTAQHAALPVMPGAATARGATRRGLIWAIVLLMRWPRNAARHCCSRAMISPQPI